MTPTEGMVCVRLSYLAAQFEKLTEAELGNHMKCTQTKLVKSGMR